jgi:hypothetical protein
VRDYQQWHEQYDDPESGMSWRLGVVRRLIAEHLDHVDGPVRVLSLCSGDGRDLIGVLRSRPDAARVHAVLVEIDPDLARRAREAAAGLDVDVRTADAAAVAGYADALPADLVLLVGIFGNISETDIRATINAARGMCAPGAMLLWSRSRKTGDRNSRIRDWFAAAGFTELDYATIDRDSHPSVGAMRYDGAPVELDGTEHLFTFTR